MNHEPLFSQSNATNREILISLRTIALCGYGNKTRVAFYCSQNDSNLSHVENLSQCSSFSTQCFTMCFLSEIESIPLLIKTVDTQYPSQTIEIDVSSLKQRNALAKLHPHPRIHLVGGYNTSCGRGVQ